MIVSEKVPKLGDQGDVLLADFSHYAVGLRKEVVLDRSNAPGWREDTSHYRTIVRVDGLGKWAAPVTPKRGDTLSWSVSLAERAQGADWAA